MANLSKQFQPFALLPLAKRTPLRNTEKQQVSVKAVKTLQNSLLLEATTRIVMFPYGGALSITGEMETVLGKRQFSFYGTFKSMSNEAFIEETTHQATLQITPESEGKYCRFNGLISHNGVQKIDFKMGMDTIGILNGPGEASAIPVCEGMGIWNFK